MVYCSNCGTANRDGSRFCNDCGAKLPSGTSVRCPQCGTPNSPSDSFCEKCGARLVPTLVDDAPEPEPSPAMSLKKGLSLPTKPDADASPGSGDWLGQLRSSIDPSTEGEAPQTSAAEGAADTNQSDWLARLTAYAADSGEPASSEDTLVSQTSGAPQPGAEAGEVPDWLTSLGIIDNTPASASAADEDVPEWLSQLPLNAAEPAVDSSAADDATEPAAPADWLGALRAATPVDSAASSDEDVPDWLRSLGTGPLTSAQPDQPVAPASPAQAAASTADEDEIPDWLRTLGTGPLSSAPTESQPAAEIAPIDNTPARQPSTPEEMPDWLRGLGAADHTQRSTDELPDWLDSLGTEAVPPQSSAEEAPSEDEVPAWLRELGASAVTQPAEPVQSADDTSDWMSALRATSQEAAVAEPTSEPVAEEVPDWLQSMGLPSAEQAPAPADDTSNWMSALRATSQEAAATEPTSEPVAEEVPDWLQSMGLPPVEQAPIATPADDTSDWMSALRATSQEAAATEPSSEPVAEDVPDWLQSMGLPSAEQAPASTPADDTSDWMSALRATSQDAAATEPTSEPVAEDVPDWLQSMGLPPAEQAPASADDTSDWMSALRATSQDAAATEPTSEPAAEDVPDWLQSMGLPPVEQAPIATPADESLDWMSALRATSQEAAATEPTSEPAAEDVPDWLQSMGLPPAEQAPAPVDETSDWMSALRATSQEAAAPKPTSEPAAEEVPDWLRDFNAPPARSGVVEPVEDLPSADEIPDWLRDVGTGIVEPAEKSEAGELPDWLQETSAAEPDAVSTAEPATELPDWLSNLQPSMEATAPVRESAQPEVPPVSPEPEAAASRVETPSFEQAAVAAELPDWLKSLREGKAAVPAQPLEPVPGLMQAEIPSWLEALRPKEGQATSVADIAAESEQEGVFAGLHNVLPPLPEPGEIPAAAQIAAGPSADDLARAGIFQELLSRSVSRPTAVPALPTRGGQAGRRLLQWGVAVALLVVILVPFLMPQGWLPFLPQADNLPTAPLVQSAATTIRVLPPNASVLVVFDYDPAQAGEMDRIAEIVLRHLQTRAAKVTTVSLNPLGAGLASSVWASIGTPPSDHWTDLGYVPGQAVGVQNVLLNHGPFALVIDLSASADGLRWWVEQLTVSGFNMPFIAGVSAAVESLALPYVQSGQITGLISGATGAMMYGRQAELLPSLEEAQQAKAVTDRTNQPPSAEVVLMVRNQYHIESQTLAHWLLAALIVIGLVSGLVSRAGRRSTP